MPIIFDVLLIFGPLLLFFAALAAVADWLEPNTNDGE